MKILIGLLLFTIFLFLSGIHIYWVLGGKRGGGAAIPTKTNNDKAINPKLLQCFVVAFVLLCFAIFILIKAGMLSFYVPGWLSHYGLWAVSILFLLRAIGEFKYVGFFKRIKTTTFGRMDTKYYSPLCVLIGILGIALQLTG